MEAKYRKRKIKTKIKYLVGFEKPHTHSQRMKSDIAST